MQKWSERFPVPFEKGLLTLVRDDDYLRLAEVDLRFGSWLVGQGHEHLWLLMA